MAPRAPRPPTRLRRSLLLALFAPLLLAAAIQRSDATSPPLADAPAALPLPRTVILVRHAEKDPQAADPRDPGLSDAGRARAADLARLLAHGGVSRLIASEFRRTQETLAPLGRALAFATNILPAGKPAELLAHLAALAPGSVAVVCGHSNTLPEIAQRLGAPLTNLVAAPAGPTLPDEAFDHLYVLTIPATGPAICLELRYGAISSSGR